jgi:hypothetical protein
VRAGGRKVVCSEDAELATTARKSRNASPEPITGSASAAKTLAPVSSLPRPVPSSPIPAYICTAMATTRYVTTMTAMQARAARPGVRALRAVSSLTVRQVSQPQ